MDVVSAWQVKDKVLHFAGLRLAAQRIGIQHWQPRGVMRSWGLALMVREADQLLSPCATDEALWLGAWLAPQSPAASVRLLDPDTGHAAIIKLPGEFQIGDVGGLPLSCRPETRQLALQLHLSCGEIEAVIPWLILGPAQWAERSGLPAPPALEGPPATGPRLG